MLTRRILITSSLAWPALQAWAATPQAEAVLRTGGVVAAFRHALAPGTFDPPGFRLGDCGTQRNLNDEGRAQARRMGEWFASRALQPSRVRSSPWCRCMETGTLTFGRAQAWDALASPRGVSETTGAANLKTLRQALAEASARRGVFEVWVTHMFVLNDLVGVNTASGEGLILQADASGAPRVLERLAVPI
ncbi:histidine phosphatase family protein [Candidatus Skiveiella danica]|uniref:histidine phosphatase family protein n=1 Tax=Candidatus Skiveiella danica TaxID=3386177 RepID=UPI0039B97E54